MASTDTPPSPRTRQIVIAARELLEQEGIEGLSMRRIAERVGIRAPSLYKHLPDKRALEAALISDGLAEWADLAEKAARESNDRLDRATPATQSPHSRCRGARCAPRDRCDGR